MAENDKLI